MAPELAVALLALLAGPPVAALFARRPGAHAGMEGFVVVVVVGLVLAHMLPHSWDLAGPVSLLAATVGLGVPVLLHRHRAPVAGGRHGPHHVHGGGRADGADGAGGADDHGEADPHGVETGGAFVLALNAFVVHALLDGMTLATWAADPLGGRAVVGAIVVHRLFVGVAVWWLVRPRAGWTGAFGVLGLACLATWVGYGAIRGDLGHLSQETLGLLQAATAGSLLHVVVAHRPTHAAGQRAARTLGALAGAVPLVAVAGGEFLARHSGPAQLALGVLAPALAVGWIARSDRVRVARTARDDASGQGPPPADVAQ